MSYRFRTTDHPAASGRAPEGGDTAFTLTFPIEDGELTVELGRAGMVRHAAGLLAMLRDDLELDAEVLAALPDVITGDSHGHG